jgi:integrase
MSDQQETKFEQWVKQFGADGEWKVCFAVMAYLGLRCGEALGLAWEHIDFEAGVIRVRQAAVMGAIQTVKSKTSKRDVPMPAHLAGMLRAYRDQSEPNDMGLLFVSDRGTPYWGTNVRLYRFYPLLQRLGIKHGGLHAFRHGVATAAFMAGAAAPTVRDTLGHADIKDNPPLHAPRIGGATQGGRVDRGSDVAAFCGERSA